ncbi:MAG: acyl carrier protein [Tissierellia bacterium]|nr:acyl carrier protein [Tissierellia bacterium]
MKAERIIEIIQEEFESYEGEITEDTDILEDLDADSVDIVSLIMALEDEFDMEFDDDDINKIRTVEDIIKYLA